MERPRLEQGLAAFAGLLGEFRRGRIVDPKLEQTGMERHAKELCESWDRRFPDFPQQYFPFTSLRGERYRGKRDAYLKGIIVGLLTCRHEDNATIVNPACVFARHARHLALRLRSFKVMATDIDPTWNRLYQRLCGRHTPGNFEFAKDSVFCPQVQVQPTAVVFFGACGAVSDGAMDYAIESQARYLMCRTCCHDNIGGNTAITRRPGFINWFFRAKNLAFSWMRRKEKYAGFYFSYRYSREHYPRSHAARGVSDADEFLEVARNSADSDICRAIIDLDRYLYLIEHGYNVWYWGELFVAERTSQIAGGNGSVGQLQR